jgi:uncharacterized OsmC-like protein
MPQKTVSVQTKIGDSYEITATTRHHTIKIDQPSPVGADVAPNPIEFFLFALGGCICTIGKTVAQQKKIALRAIEVSIEGSFDTDVLLGISTNGRAGLYEIIAYAKIDADMTKEEKEAFLREVERRCPVSDNISNASNVKVIMAE